MNYYTNANKYVCPNDRQLALRAKLRTGWSAARSEPPLSAGERAAIAEVVQRAEKLDESEARRVGRLVSRIDGMRRAARGPIQSSCLLCGERGRFLAPLRVCALCRHSACPKCVIDNPPHRDQYLCNICAETREMWKKSGAWFFKSMPKFILPEKRGGSRYSDTRLAASLQEAASTSGEQNSRTDSSECGSPLAYSAVPSFGRQASGVENHKPPPNFQEPPESWTEGVMELRHAVSGLSLNRSESFGQKSPLKRTGSKGSAYSVRSYRRDSQKLPPTPPAEKPPPPADAGCGALEVRLQYDGSSSMLACTVLRARGLPGMDMAGLADPFCRLEILPKEGTCSNRLRTKTVHKTKNPEFNETLNFYGITETDLHSKTLDVRVYDDDRYGCDAMGATSVALRDCQLGSPQTLRLALTAAPELDDGIPLPQILLGLSYNTKRRALVVVVCRCSNLPPMDSNGYSDPFVKMHLDPDPAHKKHKTSIKWRNLNPVYNEEFHFDTRPTELSRQSLTLTVWDKDYGKPDDFLGSLVIGAASKGKRLKHWLDCIRFPDHRHEQWHALTDTQHL